MMNIKDNAGTTAFVIMISTMLASIIVSFEDLFAKGFIFGGVNNTIFTTAPISVLFTGLYTVLVLFFCFAFIPRDLAFFRSKPTLSIFRIISLHFVDMRPIVVRLMTGLKPHFFKGWAKFFCKPFVPCRAPFSAFIASGSMPSDIFGDKKQPAPVPSYFNIIVWIFFSTAIFINREWVKNTVATAGASSDNLCFLCFRNSHTVLYTHKQEEINRKQRELLETLEGLPNHSMAGNSECDGLKIGSYKTISSQATWKQAEGSTTRVWSLSPYGYGGKTPRVRCPQGMI